MLKQLGRLMWHQTRDMTVMNYPGHVVYQIYTNQGFVHVCQNKTTNQIEWTTTKPIQYFSGTLQKADESLAKTPPRPPF